MPCPQQEIEALLKHILTLRELTHQAFIASNSGQWKEGEKVIVTGFDLGMNTDSGFVAYITVPETWIIKLPESLSLAEAMVYGTARFTAGLSIQALRNNGIIPEKGPVAVTGATGGVGSIAVAILAKLGYDVVAISSKENAIPFLEQLGATTVIPRQQFADNTGRPLLSARFAAAIDTVGGNMLATLIKSLHYGGIVTTCGMVGGGELHTTVFPFILKGIQLVGIDSVLVPIKKRTIVWEHLLAKEWKPSQLQQLAKTVGLKELPGYIETILNGKMKGRAIVAVDEVNL